MTLDIQTPGEEVWLDPKNIPKNTSPQAVFGRLGLDLLKVVGNNKQKNQKNKHVPQMVVQWTVIYHGRIRKTSP